MTDRIALVLAIMVTCAVIADIALNDTNAILFLAKKGMKLIEWMAFWR